MTGSDPDEATRAAARDVLSELLAGVLGDAPGKTRRNGTPQPRGNARLDGHARNGTNNGHGNGSSAGAGHSDDAVVPQVPAPPVAAVLRPSTWSRPAAPGEVIGDDALGPAAPPRPPSGVGTASIPGLPSDARVEPVSIESDEDLARFVHALLARLENPRDREAVRAGRLRFALRGSATTSAVPARPGPEASRTTSAAIRVDKGAITERVVRDAAARGARLVLAPGVVLTPLARDRARALGVEIERERRC